jgi:nitroreductase
MISRRAMLVSGGGAVLLTGTIGWGTTRAPTSARDPWRTAQDGFGDPLLDVLAYALLAPNPHNMQPWRIHRTGETSFIIYPNPDRLLPQTDPFSRQITIGFGCFLEMFHVAASQHGWRADITAFPDGRASGRLAADTAIAAVRIVRDQTVRPDPLFDQVLARRTNRAPYDLKRAVSDNQLTALTNAARTPERVGHTNAAPMLEQLRTLTSDAWRVEWETAHTREESIKVMRFSKQQTNEDPWGLAIPSVAIEALHAAGIITREKMRKPGTLAYNGSLNGYINACHASSAFMWLTTPKNDRWSQVETGRSWVRMHLKATELGLGFHPLSQALQEFPEMAAQYQHAHDALAPSGGTVQMLVRLGYAASPPEAPRERLQTKLIDV